jgi:predicted nucleic acid-binding protein
MPDRFFLDTNIFVYSFDRQEVTKRSRSRELVRDALQGNGCISWQVVQEFSNVAIKGFVVSFGPEALMEYLDAVLLPLCKLFPDRGIYHETIGVQRETGFSWYDSLILTAALKLRCTTLYTEDLQHGQVIRGLRVVDPFQ